MKLRNIYLLCKNSLDNIKKFDVAVMDGNATEYYILVGVNEIKKVLEDLSQITFFQDEIMELRELFSADLDISNGMRIDMQSWNKIDKKKRKLVEVINNVIKLYESMGYNDKNKIGLDVKLPNCYDFSDFKNYVVDIEFLLTKCPFFQHDKEKLQFESVDVGSTWLTFVVTGVAVGGASIILNNIAAFIDMCIIIKSHYLTVKQQEMVIQKMKTTDAEKEELYKSIKKIYKHMIDEFISDLERDTGIELKDEDERGRVATSIDKAEKLLQQGIQIYSTIDSPEEIKALFEPIKMEYLKNEEVKLIDKNKDK